MQPEAARAEIIRGMDAELAHPWLSGLNTQQRELVDSVKLFFQQEIKPEELAVIAGRVQ